MKKLVSVDHLSLVALFKSLALAAVLIVSNAANASETGGFNGGSDSVFQPIWDPSRVHGLDIAVDRFNQITGMAHVGYFRIEGREGSALQRIAIQRSDLDRSSNEKLRIVEGLLALVADGAYYQNLFPLPFNYEWSATQIFTEQLADKFVELLAVSRMMNHSGLSDVTINSQPARDYYRSKLYDYYNLLSRTLLRSNSQGFYQLVRVSLKDWRARWNFFARLSSKLRSETSFIFHPEGGEKDMQALRALIELAAGDNIYSNHSCLKVLVRL